MPQTRLATMRGVLSLRAIWNWRYQRSSATLMGIHLDRRRAAMITRHIFIPAALMLLFIRPAAGQNAADIDSRAAFLRDNAVVLSTIDPTIEDDSFADLRLLIDIIGNARVVGLGEQTHGDGAAFHAKTRLIQFLHQEMGFDVLVWESGMYDCRQVELALRRGESLHDVWNKGIFGIWAMSEQVQPLFDYVDATRATNRPLEIAGCDSQMTGQGTAGVLRDHLRDVFERAGEPIALRGVLAVMEPYFDPEQLRAGGHAALDLESFTIATEKLIAALEDKTGPFTHVVAHHERTLLIRALKNYTAWVEMMYFMLRSQSDDAQPGDQMRFADAREVNMAETLIWLAQEFYPDQKLIVWAASSHLTYNSRQVEMQQPGGEWVFDNDDWQPMGNLVREALGEDFYVIDCIAHTGEIGSLGRWSRPLEPAPHESWDALCHEPGIPYLFVDLRSLPARDGGAWMKDRLIARPRGYALMRANWTEICDAFLFTDVMYPSTRIEFEASKE